MEIESKVNEKAQRYKTGLKDTVHNEDIRMINDTNGSTNVRMYCDVRYNTQKRRTVTDLMIIRWEIC